MSLAPSDRKRWRLQFTIRTLLLVMLAVCIFFAGRLSRQDEMDELRMELYETRMKAEVAEDARVEADNSRLEAEREADKARMEAKNARARLAQQLINSLKPNERASAHARVIRGIGVEAGMKFDELERRRRFNRSIPMPF